MGILEKMLGKPGEGALLMEQDPGNKGVVVGMLSESSIATVLGPGSGEQKALAKDDRRIYPQASYEGFARKPLLVARSLGAMLGWRQWGP